MLPKIIVSDTQERNTLFSFLALSPASTIEYEGVSAKVDDLRHFVNFGVNLSAGLSGITLIIYDADRLSPECQAVLLKPLEDSREDVSLILVVKNENSLLPTVISRCVVVRHEELKINGKSFWKDVLDCFSIGPAKCLDFADRMDKVDTENCLEEVVVKLKSGLSNEVNLNRLKVLKLAIDCLSKVRNTNVNAKLAFGNFLISSWRLVKA